METSSLKKNQPFLESVFGSLSVEEDAEIRTIFEKADAILLQIAARFGHNSTGWEGSGLELTWMKSGQTSISGNVSTISNDICVDFSIDLMPSWYNGTRSSTLSWNIEKSVSVDCNHSVDHGHMHRVFRTKIEADSPIKAAQTLFTETQALSQLTIETPLSHWAELASDSSESET